MIPKVSIMSIVADNLMLDLPAIRHHIAQFIELAAYYSPYNSVGVDQNYNLELAKHLDEIVAYD